MRLQPLGCCGRSRGDITLGDRKERLASQIELGSKPCTETKKKIAILQPNAHVLNVALSSTLFENIPKMSQFHRL